MLRFLFFSADHSYISAEILLIFLLPEDLNPAVPESGSSHTDHHVQPDPSWKRFPYLTGGFFFLSVRPPGSYRSHLHIALILLPRRQIQPL